MRLKLPSNEQILFLANVLLDKVFYARVKSENIRDILVIKWDEIGDMVVATHVFEMLKQKYPQAKIHLICKPFVKPLIAHDPHIDYIATTLHAYNRKFDAVIVLRGTWTTWLKTFKYRPVNRVSRAVVRWANKGKQLHEIDTNAEVVKPLLGQMDKLFWPKLYFSADDEQQVDAFLKQNQLSRFAIVHAGARKKLRQWPLNRFALAVKHLKHKHHLDIVFAGTEEDESDIKIINDQLDFKTASFTRGFSLSQFNALCSKASFYLGNESGPLQIASVFNLPLIGLFGPGVKDVFYPRGAKARVIHPILECNPCDQVHCVRPENPCIQLIDIHEVTGTIDILL
ncbi:MAG: glycosyltransferase family 9 protein [Bacteroidetes bacterium]|nr:glycosyltransferase family 9 protein [Bacteroidota bacterium]